MVLFSGDWLGGTNWMSLFRTGYLPWTYWSWTPSWAHRHFERSVLFLLYFLKDFIFKKVWKLTDSSLVSFDRVLSVHTWNYFVILAVILTIRSWICSSSRLFHTCLCRSPVAATSRVLTSLTTSRLAAIDCGSWLVQNSTLHIVEYILPAMMWI